SLISSTYPPTLPSFPTRRSSDLEGVLGGVRHLQHDLVQLHIVPARGRLDVFGIEGVGGGSRLGINTRALLVQMLRGDDDSGQIGDRKSTRLNSSHGSISYAVFCL